MRFLTNVFSSDAPWTRFKVRDGNAFVPTERPGRESRTLDELLRLANAHGSVRIVKAPAGYVPPLPRLDVGVW